MSKSAFPAFSGGYGVPYRRYKGSSQFRKQRRKQRRPRTRASRMPRKVSGLSRQVKELKRLAEADMGTHIHRIRRIVRVTANDAMMNRGSVDASTIISLEEVLALLRYFDPANPATLVVADGALGSYQRDYYFTRVHTVARIRNNYQVPAQIRLYGLVPKDDTSISPTVAFTNGLADVGNPSSVSPMVHLTDSDQFNDLWRIRVSKLITLEAGRTCRLSMTAKPFKFDPSTADSHSLTYQTHYNSMAWIVFIHGVMGHDTVLSEQGIIGAGIECSIDTVFEVKYPAGADIKFITLDDQSNQSFTNLGVCSNMPVADNQATSQA